MGKSSSISGARLATEPWRPKNVMFGNGALAGTSPLAVKYKGKLPAVLEQRTDLTPVMIKSVVRHGFVGMPITRKTEISDAELEDVVALFYAESEEVKQSATMPLPGISPVKGLPKDLSTSWSPSIGLTKRRRHPSGFA